MKKTIMITGANGQLGADLVDVLSTYYQIIPITHDEIDLCETERVNELIHSVKPDILINTAAFHHVEKCETETEKAYEVNATVPQHLAAVCAQLNIRLMHISTAYVFDGKQSSPYTETDTAVPLNMYGKSKLEGEKRVLETSPDSLVVRVSALYGNHPCRAKNGLNFVQLMLKLAREKGEVTVVDDAFIAPTFTMSIAEQIVPLLESSISGIVHMNSEGSCSWYELADEIFKYTGTPVKLFPSHTADDPSQVKRPTFSVLSNHVLQTAGINHMPHWKDALHQYLDQSEN